MNFNSNKTIWTHILNSRDWSKLKSIMICNIYFYTVGGLINNRNINDLTNKNWP